MSNQQKFTAFSFDANSVPPQQPLEAIPAGFYNVAITDGEIVPTADGTGRRLKFEMTVLDGDFKGRKVFDGLNIANKSAQAQEIGWQQLSAICHATGVLRLTDVQELYNKPFSAKVGYEGQRTDQQTGQTYEPRNTFKGARPLNGNGGGVASPTARPVGNGVPAGVPAGMPAPNWVVQPAAPVAGMPAQPAVPLPAAPTVPPFAAPAPVAPAPKVKRMAMTAKANGLTAEQFRASDPAWTDELLVREGYAVIEEMAAPAPAAPAMPAAPVAPPAGTSAAPWRK